MGKKLTKSRNNIVLTGTLAGIAEYFNIDPTLVRIIYVIFSIPLVGSPIFLYILLALIVPSANKGYRNSSSYDSYRHPYESQTDYYQSKRPRKEAKKVKEDDWSDF